MIQHNITFHQFLPPPYININITLPSLLSSHKQMQFPSSESMCALLGCQWWSVRPHLKARKDISLSTTPNFNKDTKQKVDRNYNLMLSFDYCAQWNSVFNMNIISALNYLGFESRHQPSCVAAACSPHAGAGFLHVRWLPLTFQTRMWRIAHRCEC